MTRTEWRSDDTPPPVPRDWLERAWLLDLVIIAEIAIVTALILWAIYRVFGPLVLPPYCTS